MKKFLSSIGIGNATVDTVLPGGEFERGKSVKAEVQVDGGDTDQEIEEIEFALGTRYRTEEGYGHTTIAEFDVPERFTIGPGEHKSFPVEFRIPHHTPVSVGSTRVWLRTGLDIDWAVDPTDKDEIKVLPDGRTQALFDAMEALGFTLTSAECTRIVRGFDHEFAQEFDFRARSGRYARELDEVELLCDPEPGELQVTLEVDRRGGGLFGLDESHDFMHVQSTDAEAIKQQLQQRIERAL